jgi:hypothetical protein
MLVSSFGTNAMSDPTDETAISLRAKAERCMRLSRFMRDDIRDRLVGMASDYLERAIELEERRRGE